MNLNFWISKSDFLQPIFIFQENVKIIRERNFSIVKHFKWNLKNDILKNGSYCQIYTPSPTAPPMSYLDKLGQRPLLRSLDTHSEQDFCFLWILKEYMIVMINSFWFWTRRNSAHQYVNMTMFLSIWNATKTSFSHAMKSINIYFFLFPYAYMACV